MAAEEQKPMFKAEQEAEKALGYLEGLSLAQLAAVLLTSAMTSFHMMMSCDIKIRCSRDRASAAPRGLDEDFDLEEELQQDLDALERLIKEAAELIEKDTSMFGTTNHAESSVSQQTLLVIDQVCNRMFELEILQLKMKACEETLDRHHRIIAALSRNGSATAQSSAEAKHLLALAKSASFGGDSHSWHSYDGRELGPPSRKVFDLRCRAECKLLIAPTLPHDNKRPLEHIMRAVLENDELRIAFKLFESDGAM
ncbi:unnamed protein product [Symbiodinium microadriaticum]|nr:unnamed protein product [Symbiodinium microadriaticum]